MDEIKKVSLIGLGAIGSFFAPRLYNWLDKGNFRVIADGERKERLETRGLTVNDINYKFPVITPDYDKDTSDLIIISVKSTALDQAIKDIKNQVGPDTLILCILNGIDNEEKVASVYGWEHVLYSYMYANIEMKNPVFLIFAYSVIEVFFTIPFFVAIKRYVSSLYSLILMMAVTFSPGVN